MSQLLKHVWVADLLKVYIGLHRKISYHGCRLYTLRTSIHYNKTLPAPRHKAQDHQSLYEVNMAKYWSWTIWPPSYPCLNPLDYAIGTVPREALIHRKKCPGLGPILGMPQGSQKYPNENILCVSNREIWIFHFYVLKNVSKLDIR